MHNLAKSTWPEISCTPQEVGHASCKYYLLKKQSNDLQRVVVEPFLLFLQTENLF